MKEIMKKLDKKIVYIITVVMGFFAIFNMMKSKSLISMAMNDSQLIETQAVSMKIFMYLMILLSACFIGLLAYKFFYMKERDYVYAAAMICAVLLLITVCNGAVFYGAVVSADYVDEAQSLRLLKAFLNYMGASKLSGLTFLGTAVWTIYRFIKGNKTEPKEVLLLETELKNTENEE